MWIHNSSMQISASKLVINNTDRLLYTVVRALNKYVSKYDNRLDLARLMLTIGWSNHRVLHHRVNKRGKLCPFVIIG